MDAKTTILETTIKMLKQIGVTSTTMDAIAHACGMSKRTIYEHFPDKTTLITEAVHYLHNRKCEDMVKVLAESDNHLSALLNVYNYERKEMLSTAQVLIEDIRRIYPSLYDEFMMMHEDNGKYLIRILEEAQKDGMIRKNADIEATVMMFSIFSFCAHREAQSISERISVDRVVDAGFRNFIRGLASQEGLAVIDRFFDNIDNKR